MESDCRNRPVLYSAVRPVCIYHAGYIFGTSGTGFPPVKVDYVKKIMAENPGKKFFLCAHDFYVGQETQEFKDLLADPDILCLFAGHTHESRIFSLGSEFHNKCLVRTGNYAYSHAFEGQFASWGWRELICEDDQKRVKTEYLLPETKYIVKGEQRSHEAFRRDGIELRY